MNSPMLDLARSVYSITVAVIASLSFLTAAILGVFGVCALFRYKDPYIKLQASSLAGTTAVFSTLVGALLSSPSLSIAARIILITLFFFISAPTGTNIVANYIWKSGVEATTTGISKLPNPAGKWLSGKASTHPRNPLRNPQRNPPREHDQAHDRHRTSQAHPGDTENPQARPVDHTDSTGIES